MFKSAKPAFKILKSPLNTHKNNPLINKNIAITRYPIGVPKNKFNSFFKMANIYFDFYQTLLTLNVVFVVQTYHFIDTPGQWFF